MTIVEKPVSQMIETQELVLSSSKSMKADNAIGQQQAENIRTGAPGTPVSELSDSQIRDRLGLSDNTQISRGAGNGFGNVTLTSTADNGTTFNTTIGAGASIDDDGVIHGTVEHSKTTPTENGDIVSTSTTSGSVRLNEAGKLEAYNGTITGVVENPDGTSKRFEATGSYDADTGHFSESLDNRLYDEFGRLTHTSTGVNSVQDDEFGRRQYSSNVAETIYDPENGQPTHTNDIHYEGEFSESGFQGTLSITTTPLDDSTPPVNKTYTGTVASVNTPSQLLDSMFGPNPLEGFTGNIVTEQDGDESNTAYSNGRNIGDSGTVIT